MIKLERTVVCRRNKERWYASLNVFVRPKTVLLPNVFCLKLFVDLCRECRNGGAENSAEAPTITYTAPRIE